MVSKKHIPLLVTPYSKKIVGGISSWTKNMLDYAEITNHQNIYQIHCYANHLMTVTDTKIISRIISGTIVYLKLISQVFMLIFKYKPTVLHITSSANLGLLKDIIIIKLAKQTGTSTIIHWHFGRIPELARINNWEWKLLKYVIRNSKSSIVIDKKSYDTLIEHGFNNVVNIPNPIPFDIEQKAKIIFEQDSARSFGRILFVGHVLKEKGVFELVEACIDIPEIQELIIIGPYEENIKSALITRAKKRQDGNWLKMLGQQNKDQVLNSMANSQILILPSYTEGFPNVVIEAMAMGCAIVATDVGAIPEMINFGHEKPCGICVPPQNVEKLKEAILELIKDTEITRKMGRRGIKKVLNNYTLEKVIKQYLKIWDEVTKRKN